MKPIFVITLTYPISTDKREEIASKMQDYHVMFLHGDKDNCQLFSIKETIELTDLKQLQQYLDEHNT